jgi:gamma-glutamylcyclotransferase (GGCT)/AIG2-like uncharacterized protein YtfP
MTRLFFYGTLQPAADTPRAHVLAGLGRSGGHATLSGYDMLSVGSAFPAIVPGTGTVKGEVVDVFAGRGAEALSICDAIEGYDGPGKPHNLYERKDVRLDDGTWAYVYVWAKDRRNMPVIPSGDWLEHRADSWLARHAESFKRHLAAIQAEGEAGTEDCPGCGATDCTPATCPAYAEEEAWDRWADDASC